MATVTSTGITLAIAIEQLQLWLNASSVVSQGQEYTIESGGVKRVYKAADAAVIAKQLSYWNAAVMRLNGGGGLIVREIIPR